MIKKQLETEKDLNVTQEVRGLAALNRRFRMESAFLRASSFRPNSARMMSGRGCPWGVVS